MSKIRLWRVGSPPRIRIRFHVILFSILWVTKSSISATGISTLLGAWVHERLQFKHFKLHL